VPVSSSSTGASSRTRFIAATCRPTCTVHIDPLLNLAIFQRHIDQNTAFRQGRIRIVGDVAVVARLRPIMLRQSNATGDGFRE